MIYPSNSCPFEQTVPVYEKKKMMKEPVDIKTGSNVNSATVQPTLYAALQSVYLQTSIFKILKGKKIKARISFAESLDEYQHGQRQRLEI